MSNNYIVSSPGRCGSTFLSAYLHNQYTRRDNINYKFMHISELSHLEHKISDTIIHIHNINLLTKICNTANQIILIRRNPVEVVVSTLIAEQTGVWHFRSKDFDKNKVDIDTYKTKYQNHKFSLDDDIFIKKLHCVCNWYVEAANLENIITFNYLEAIDVNKINNKLNLKPMYNLRLTQAQPFDKWQKIENAQYFRDFGNKIFSQYQHQYPDIFPSSDFDIENHI